MAEIKFDLKKFFAKININRTTYIVGFLVTAILLTLYTFILNSAGKEKLGGMYDLKSEHDAFESASGLFHNQLEKAHINSLLYVSDGLEIYRLQAVTALNDANKAYNDLFAQVMKIEDSQLPLLLQIRDKLFETDNSFLAKLASDIALPDTEFSSIVTTEDTLSFDLAVVEPDTGGSEINFADEAAKLKSIEDDLFELGATISSTLGRNAQSQAREGIYKLGTHLLFILLLMITFFLLYNQIKNNDRKQIQISSEHLKSISTGELPEKLKPGKNQFVQLVENSNLIIDYMHDASEFANNIGEGNFRYEFKPKGKEDKLGNALIEMRNKLQQVATEDKIRNWVNEGQAKFGEILRNTGNDIEKMGDEIMSNLVKYLDASLGVIYVKNEDHHETQLELLSAYAFNRKKHEERKLKVGEGLAGQVFMEKKRVFLKDIKSSHFNIVTGMGESKPSSVLIVPLKQEDSIEGVLELASFNVFEEYQIGFVEKVGESIATAIRSGKTNRVTNELLQEMQTREEEMRTQEEELKQNMEELSATQEQMERLRKEDEERKIELETKRKTLYGILDNLDACVYLKNHTGKYQYVNKKYADLMSLNIDRFIDHSDEELLGDEIASKRMKWESSAIKSPTAIVEKEDLSGQTYSLKLTSIDLPNTSEKGVLGVLTKHD